MARSAPYKTARTAARVNRCRMSRAQRAATTLCACVAVHTEAHNIQTLPTPPPPSPFSILAVSLVLA